MTHAIVIKGATSKMTIRNLIVQLILANLKIVVEKVLLSDGKHSINILLRNMKWINVVPSALDLISWLHMSPK